MSGNELRSIARYDFEGGGYIEIRVFGDVPTLEAISMAETLLTIKKAEIAARTQEQDS